MCTHIENKFETNVCCCFDHFNDGDVNDSGGENFEFFDLLLLEDDNLFLDGLIVVVTGDNAWQQLMQMPTVLQLDCNDDDDEVDVVRMIQ